MTHAKENQMYQLHTQFLRYQVAMRRKSMATTDTDTKRHFETFADQFYALGGECVTYLEYADTASDQTKHLRSAVCLTRAAEDKRNEKIYNSTLSHYYYVLAGYMEKFADEWYALIPESSKKQASNNLPSASPVKSGPG